MSIFQLVQFARKRYLFVYQVYKWLKINNKSFLIHFVLKAEEILLNDLAFENY